MDNLTENIQESHLALPTTTSEFHYVRRLRKGTLIV